MIENPFTPTFGVTPPLLVGRDALLAEFSDALDDGVGAIFRSLTITGVRGSGKTVTLNAVEDIAARKGWLVVSATSRAGMARQLANELHRLCNEQTDSPANLRNLALAQEQVSGEFPTTISLRAAIGRAASMMAADHGAGVLITLDEVDRAAAADILELSQAVQHAFREGLEVALVIAGLAGAVNELVLDNPLTTFMRRTERFTLGPVSDADVAEAIRAPIINLGRRITEDSLAAAVEAAEGYPFLIQLIGSHTWRYAGEDDAIGLTAATQGCRHAIRRLGTLVHAPALRSLSDTDRSFLSAMAVDDGPSRMGDVAERLNVNAQYAGVYRKRCIDRGLVEPAGRGLVTFTIPHLREYLQDDTASAALLD